MDRLGIIDSESRRLAEVLATAEPDSICPTCPEWTAADLLWHLTEVHIFWAEVLGRSVRVFDELAAVGRAKPERPETISRTLELREQATATLLRELAGRDDAEPLWSWWPPDQTVGFTRRMQTYEATMHRVDAELTAGSPVSPLAPEVAEGAVDHAVDVMWGWLPETAIYRPRGIIEFAATDTGARWLVEVGGCQTTEREPPVTTPRAVRAATGDPTATVTAPAQDLALWAWTRGGAVAITGDPAAIAALNALVTQGMP